MIYEIRVYEAVDGRAEVMRERFEKEVAPRLPNFGIELMGVFVNKDEEDGRLTYITRFPDEEARKSAWSSFSSDPEWTAIKAASEVDGPILARQTVSLLSPRLNDLPLG